MATVSRGLPPRPHLDVPKREARALLKQLLAKERTALERILRRHPKFHETEQASIMAMEFRLSDAQLVIAREYGFSNWAALKQRIDSHSLAAALDEAIRSDDCDGVMRLLRDHPALLHLPVRSGNWGPPLSHAANLGRFEIVRAIASLGARDLQHAFDRAVLQGKLDCARWLHEHGAKLAPGIVMGACETLNPAGLRFLSDLDAPFTDQRGNPLAPLALALETYSRNPDGKHEVLELFSQRGYLMPDTPIMAFHFGRTDRLAGHLRRDPGLIERRFSTREIYPPELGCSQDGRSGMHGTPLDGTTLLHLAIDFDEQEIIPLLLAQGADVNARATIDDAGFGGHTPLFNAVVNSACSCGRQRGSAVTRSLLDHGASPALRATLRKYLDWCESPRWHEAHQVSAAEWGRSFPEESWVNREALQLLDESASSRSI
jgi:ankyrin repeat protein